MQIHWFIAFLVSAVFLESRSAALDLDTAVSFLLDVLNVLTSLANNLRAQIKARDGFQVNWNAFFGPFWLHTIVSV